MTAGGPRRLTFQVAGTGERVALADVHAVVAGYTGRDEAAVREHIAELAAIGVPPPASVPAFYPVDSALLTQQETVPVRGLNTSGEVEPVLVRAGGALFLTVGSDHTDRDLERTDIAASKRACPKPVCRQLVRLPAPPERLDWDAVQVSCHVDGVAYQSGRLAALRVPTDVLAMYAGPGDGDLVMFGGTLPLLTGTFVAGTRWQLSLALPDGTVLRHAYTAERAT